MDEKKKSKENKNKLEDTNLIYKLEIAYNEKTGVIEYITESVCKETPAGPVDSNFDYIEDYWDEETLRLFENLYEVGEA